MYILENAQSCKEDNSQKVGRFDQSIAVGQRGIDILQHVVDVTDAHADNVHPHGVAQDHGAAQQHPWQVGSLEVEHAEEVHWHQRVAARPHVDQHQCEGLAQEQQVDEDPKKGHQNAAENEHHDKVRAAAAERAVLQHAAVAVREHHIEEKADADCAEV